MTSGRTISIHFASMALAFATSGCLVGGLDLDNRACPCTDGYVCNEETQICVAGDAPPMGDPNAAIKPSNLEAEWVTSHSIRWTWSTGDDDVSNEFGRYELLVRGEDGSEVLVNGAVNLELGRYRIPRSDGDEVSVVGTIVDLLQPDTGYTAKLTAFDSSEREWRTNEATTRTTPSLDNVALLFSEDEVGDTSQPADFVRSMGGAYQGDFAYSWDNQGCVGACPQGLVRDGLASDNDIGQTTLEHAYFEMAIALTASQPTFFAQLQVTCADGASRNLYAPITLRSDGSYRLFQVPLSAFQRAMLPLELDDVAPPCTAFGVNALWADDASVRIDEVRIVY